MIPDLAKPNGYFAATLIEAELDHVQLNITDRLSRGGRAIDVKRLPAGELPLPKQAYNPAVMSVLLWAPASLPDTTVFYPNLTDGWQTLVYGFATEENAPCLSIRLGIDDIAWPIREMTIYRDGKQRRLVRVMRGDTRWDFFEQGQRYAFEDENAYRLKSVRKRLSTELLMDYCERLGWPIRAADTWFTRETIYLISRPKKRRSEAS